MKRCLSLSSACLFLISLSACALDRDDNPPGPRGGPGTNWENPPGRAGGPGTSPDRITVVVRGAPVELIHYSGRYYHHPRYGYFHARHGWWNQSARCWIDRDDNPPGRRGGSGTNWENPPGLRGGPGTSPDRFGRCR